MAAAEQSVLARIVAAKQGEAARLHLEPGLASLRRAAEHAARPRDFIAALRRAPGAAIIAEIKRRAPSSGPLALEVDPAAQARAYESGGAACLSVLTDNHFFGGSLQDLAAARQACSLPVLRKDFLLQEIQVFEARAAGADAVLLIAAALAPARLESLHRLAAELGMAALVEVHNRAELSQALSVEPRLLGINNRNLATLEVDLQTSLALRPLISDGVLVVAESGIAAGQDIARLRRGGLDAFLVGSSLMRAADPRAAVAALVSAGEAG